MSNDRMLNQSVLQAYFATDRINITNRSCVYVWQNSKH